MRSGRSRSRYCSVPRCGLPAYCYCQTDSTLLCRSHVGPHRDKGHDIFLHECDLCGGHGRVHGQYASRDPGGRWVRCPRCFGIGFLSGPVRRHGGEDKAGEKRENAPRAREAASEVQSKQRDKETVRESEDAVEKARVASEVARKAGAERRAREAARKAERERRARESASKGGDRRPAEETQGRKTDAGRGQHRGCKQIRRCLVLACLVLLIAGGVVGGYLALPYFVDEGEEAVPSPTSTSAPPTALPQRQPLALLLPRFSPQLRCLSPSRPTCNPWPPTRRHSSGCMKPRMVRTGRTIATGSATRPLGSGTGWIRTRMAGSPSCI